MIKEYLENRFRKLDNTAKIFSLDSKENTNTFRCCVILKHKVDKQILKKALDRALNNFSAFKVKLVSGFFWNRLEFNSKEPLIKQDSDISCKRIDFKTNNDYLFKVTYYKKKINLDVFHILTDGAGAIKFLKSIIYNYLDLKFNLSKEEIVNYSNINCLDQYLNTYDKRIKERAKFISSYLLPNKYNKKINNVYQYTIDIRKIKPICKKYNVTVTEYLTALYIYAIYLSMYNKKSKREIVITVPINLRNYYNVDTLSNFFVCMNINSKILEKKLTTFKQVLHQVCVEFKKKLTSEKIKKYLARDVKLGTNIPVSLVPLFIKKQVMQSVGPLIAKPTTSTLSNLGIIDIENNYKKYIDNIVIHAMPCKFQKIKCTVSSFDNKLNISINSNIDDSRFQAVFLKLLEHNVKGIKIEGNN